MDLSYPYSRHINGAGVCIFYVFGNGLKVSQTLPYKNKEGQPFISSIEDPKSLPRGLPQKIMF